MEPAPIRVWISSIASFVFGGIVRCSLSCFVIVLAGLPFKVLAGNGNDGNSQKCAQKQYRIVGFHTRNRREAKYRQVGQGNSLVPCPPKDVGNYFYRCRATPLRFQRKLIRIDAYFMFALRLVQSPFSSPTERSGLVRAPERGGKYGHWSYYPLLSMHSY